MLAAEIWHWWIGVVLLGVSVLTVVGLAVGYLKNVTAQRYPSRKQRATATDRRPPGAGPTWTSTTSSTAARSPRRGRRSAVRFSGGADSTALVLLAVRRRVPRRRPCTSTTACVPRRRDEAGAGRRPRRHDRGAVPLPGASPSRRDRTSKRGPATLATRRSRAGAATGHTADDQAETVLINLLRGAGTTGSPGCDPVTRHPILALRRADTRRLVLANGLTPVVDPTNADPRFVRNRVRGELLPLLDAIAGRDVAALLARTRRRARRRRACSSTTWPASSTSTDARAVAAAPRPLGRRAVRRWLTGPDGHPPDRSPWSTGCSPWPPGRRVACEIDGGRRVERHRQRLRIRRSRVPGQSGDRAVVSYDEMGNSDHAGVTR